MPHQYSNSLTLSTPKVKIFDICKSQIYEMANPSNLTKDARMPDRDIDASSYKAIGKRLNHLRRVMGLTQAQIAEMLSMTGPRWANYETGTSRIPVDEALKLVRIASVSLDWIYYGNRAVLPLHLAEKIDAMATEPPKPRGRSPRN